MRARRVLVAAAAAFLTASAPAGALAVLDDAGALRLLVEGDAPRTYALVIEGGPPAHVAWTTPDGARVVLALGEEERSFALAPGAHALDPLAREGGFLLVIPEDPGEAGAALPLDADAPEAAERALRSAPLAGIASLVAGSVLLAVCSRKLKARFAPGSRHHPRGGDP